MRQLDQQKSCYPISSYSSNRKLKRESDRVCRFAYGKNHFNLELESERAQARPDTPDEVNSKLTGKTFHRNGKKKVVQHNYVIE